MLLEDDVEEVEVEDSEVLDVELVEDEDAIDALEVPEDVTLEDCLSC